MAATHNPQKRTSLPSRAGIAWRTSIAWLKNRPALVTAVIVFGLLFVLLWVNGSALSGMGFNNVIEVLKVISWPAIAVFALLLLYKPFSVFLSQSVQTIKVSILQFSVEASKASTAPPALSTLVEDLESADGAELASDSTRDLTQGFVSKLAVDYLIIDIGDENEKKWLTTRLFLGAMMLERMWGLRCLVFVDNTPDVSRRFLGMASPSELRWQLAIDSPWLEPALAQASFFNQYTQLGDRYNKKEFTFNLANLSPEVPDEIVSVCGALNPPQATRLAGIFLENPNIRKDASPDGEADNSTWEKIAHKGRQPYWEHANWIDVAWVKKRDKIIKQDDNAFIKSNPDKSEIEQAQAILRRKGPFIAIVSEERQFKDLVDRHRLLENVGAGFLKELDAKTGV